MRIAGYTAGLPPSLSASEVFSGLVLTERIQKEREQKLALTLFGALRVQTEGGTIFDMAPHLFSQETIDAVKRQTEQEKEKGAQMQQLILLKKLSEMGNDGS